MWPTRTPRLMPAGPARNCRPRPSGNSPPAAGWTARNSPGATSSCRRPAHGQHLAGRISAPESRRRMASRAPRRSPHSRRTATACYDMIGNVWEWTGDWYSPKHEADALKACCIPRKPSRRARGGSYDPCQPQHQDPTQGAERRLASLRAELLPPLSAGGAPCRSRSIPRRAMSASGASRGRGVDVMSNDRFRKA